MKNLLVPILVLLSLCSMAQQQVAKTIPYVASPNGVSIGFLQYTPSDYGTQKHPLIIFLHGLDERGNGTTQVQTVATNAGSIPYLCAHGASMRFTVNGQTSSFVVLSPQLDQQIGAWPTYYVQQMIAYAKANLSIDINRIYVTGLSLGGGGCWTYAFESYANASAIAAIAPVCGTDYGNDPNACTSAGTANLPIWGFHCEDDATVASTNMSHIQITLNIGCPTYASTARWTYYVSGGHGGAWLNAYDTGHITRAVDSSYVKNGARPNANFTASPNLYEWFLLHRRSQAQAPVTPPTVSTGTNQSIALPTTSVALTGQATGTNGATISSLTWSQVSGPSTAVLVTPTLASTNAVGLAQGTYVFQLQASDNNGSRTTAQTTVQVLPAPIRTIVGMAISYNTDGSIRVITVTWNDGTSKTYQ